MGIKNLTKFLKTKYPQIFRQVNLSYFQHKKIAIDISIYICRFKVSHGVNWLDALLKMVICLRKHNIHCIFVYDGGFPVEKNAEHNKRKMTRQRNLDRINNLQNEINEYIKSGTTTKNLENIMEIYYLQSKSPSGRILLPFSSNQHIKIDVDIIKFKIEKMKRYIFSITPNDYEISKILLNILSIPWVVATMEAETLCSDLCIQNKVDAVLSEDSDVFAYGNPSTIIHINIFEETCTIINYSDIIESMHLTSDSFLDFCIMCGSDYNMNIPKIGVERSYAYISQYKSIEYFSESTHIDVSSLKYNEVRNIFRNYTSVINFDVPHCSIPDYDSLKLFIFKHNIITNFESIKNCFSKNTLE